MNGKDMLLAGYRWMNILIILFLLSFSVSLPLETTELTPFFLAGFVSGFCALGVFLHLKLGRLASWHRYINVGIFASLAGIIGTNYVVYRTFSGMGDMRWVLFVVLMFMTAIGIASLTHWLLILLYRRD